MCTSGSSVGACICEIRHKEAQLEIVAAPHRCSDTFIFGNVHLCCGKVTCAVIQSVAHGINVIDTARNYRCYGVIAPAVLLLLLLQCEWPVLEP